jgi:RNA polymerase subunit RPABC4/transcription elongation factor Spt4
MKHLSDDRLCPVRGSKRAHAKWKSEVLALETTCSAVEFLVYGCLLAEA